MHMSNRGISLLKSYEGCSLKAYWDVNGYAIGYGHHGNVKKGDTITQEKADALLISDLAKRYEPSVNVYKEVYSFNQNEYDALVDFCYNCGAGNLNKLLKNGTASRSQIRASILRYNKAAGKPLASLSRRRAEELRLFDESVVSEDCYPRYTGSSAKVDEVLREVGAPYGNWKARKPLAIANGITSYTGTASQNLLLIKKAKSGTLTRAKA